MFEKLKELNKLRQMQSAIQQEKAEAVVDGTRIVINGTFEVIEVSLNPELSKDAQEKALKECFAQAHKSIQSVIAKNFAGSLF
jgi:DNA-binding protein YbaB